MRKKEVRELRKKDHGIVDMLMILQHFFKDFRNWIQKMKDPRHQSYITYAQTDLVYLAVLKNLCSQHSMRQMEENFNEENCIAILRLLSGNEDLEEMILAGRGKSKTRASIIKKTELTGLNILTAEIRQQ